MRWASISVEWCEMRIKKCLKCGKLFNTAKNEQTLCDNCVAAGRATTIRPRTCHECGAIFDGGPRAWYCPSCRTVRQKEAAARYRKNGVDRPLGSIDHCTVCGKEYVVKSGRQRYCPECADDAVRQQDRMASKQWNAENNFYEERSQRSRSGQKVCVICGKPVPPGTPRITCSDECDRLRLKWNRGNTDFRRGKQASPPTVDRLDKDSPPAPIKLTPEVIKDLEQDLLSVIGQCPECGRPFVKKSGAARLCRECAKKRQLGQIKASAEQREYSEARRAYQAAYYAKNKDRILAQRKKKQNEEK